MALDTLIGPHANITGHYTTAAMQKTLLGCTEHVFKLLEDHVEHYVCNGKSFQETWSSIEQSKYSWCKALTRRMTGILPATLESVKTNMYISALSRNQADGQAEALSKAKVVGETTDTKRRWNQDRDQDDDEPEPVKKVKIEAEQPTEAQQQSLLALHARKTTAGQPAAAEATYPSEVSTNDASAQPGNGLDLDSSEIASKATPLLKEMLGPGEKQTVMQAMESFLETEMKTRVEKANSEIGHKARLDAREKDLERRESSVAKMSALVASKVAEQDQSEKMLEEREKNVLADEEQLNELKNVLEVRDKELAALDKKLTAKAKKQDEEGKWLRDEGQQQGRMRAQLQDEMVEADQAKKRKQKSAKKEKAKWTSEMTERIRAELVKGMNRALDADQAKWTSEMTERIRTELLKGMDRALNADRFPFL
ncbi:uncharacterized protein MYCGRDRAFT_92970 [Zymoseptoria tritici IPO323]|uniref:Uncharacterized protein n=1 Tax=Zymoseptoria tritici (strain CBS 115943 / IPO323) TaxID=336722 RepID=F9XAL7_ZYMTI|nr:uncharacterized protein MYCGRDRAFT_92970 [Zymoseptoria tritici IPO323]EGP87019.1 hypothetical protein MYCGRDRAFT_92970 [Zymoseptoria tritici IPO323]